MISGAPRSSRNTLIAILKIITTSDRVNEIVMNPRKCGIMNFGRDGLNKTKEIMGIPVVT